MTEPPFVIAGLEIVRKRCQFSGCEDRAINTDIDRADVAAPAFTYAAFHAVFHGGDHLILFEAKAFQRFKGEFDHDGWATDDGDGVLWVGLDLIFQYVRHETHMTIPIFGLATGVNGFDHGDVVHLIPLFKLAFVDQILHGFGTVDHGDVFEAAILFAQIEAVPDDGTQWGQGNTTTDEDEVFTFPVIQREGVAIGAAKADGVTFCQVGKSCSILACLTEATLDVIRAGGGGGDTECTLSRAKGGVFAKLTSLEAKVFGDVFILKLQVKGFDARRFLDDLGNGHEIGLIDIGHGCNTFIIRLILETHPCGAYVINHSR